MKQSARRTLVALIVAGVAAAAMAAPREWSDALGGRLAQIKASGSVRIGYRESAIPFSYVGPDGKPVGYSIDLCQAVVATIAEDLDLPAITIDYVRVTAQDRLERVASGAVDLECGSTTNTAERRALVAFSPVIFVTATRLAVPAASGVRSVDDLRGRKVAVVHGTTNEAAMREVDRLRKLKLELVVFDDYPAALAAVMKREVAALAADEVLLRGMLAETGNARNARITGEALSFERYGIVYERDDPALAETVDRALRGLAESREIAWIYERWFVRPLPSGVRLGLPMSAELRRSLELIGLPPD
jgi:ABC-type amino acid transport substrate-binding protein